MHKGNQEGGMKGDFHKHSNPRPETRTEARGMIETKERVDDGWQCPSPGSAGVLRGQLNLVSLFTSLFPPPSVPSYLQSAQGQR